MIETIKHARRAGVPLVAINTRDAAATVRHVAESVNNGCPKLTWNCMTGLSGINPEGQQVADQLGDDADDPFTLLRNAAPKLPASTILFVHAAQTLVGNPMTVQAVWNLRDLFKQDQRMLILLDTNIDLPPQLAGDIVVLDEPLPTSEQLREVIADVAESAGVTLTDDDVDRTVQALTGSPSVFAAEQIVAMSIRPDGMDHDATWERKRKAIEATPGLSVYRGTESFDDVGGVANVKTFIKRLLDGNDRPGCVVFVDEIEKTFAGASGDTSGTSQDQLGCILSHMQDHRSPGCLFLGPPGSAKSMVAKCAGSYAGIPTISLDLGSAKASLVGQSEARLREALRVIDAVSGGTALWLATCNKIETLPPELRRRFKLGTFFFDLPTPEERAEIWTLKCQQYEVQRPKPGQPDDTDWTGAEIEACCEISWRLQLTLNEAAQYVVPIARSAPEQVESLRAQSNGRYISASYQGVYRRDSRQNSAKRAVNLKG